MCPHPTPTHRYRLLLIIGFALVMLLLPVARQATLTAQSDAGNDIPDDCANTRAPDYRAGIFVRYEPHNRRLVLVDWTTGAEVLELGTNLDDTLIRGWSWDCHYLAVATGSDASRATVVYDTLTGARIGDVPDAHRAPHPITWGPGSFLMVETRNGAVLWDVPRNQQYSYDTGFHTILNRNFTELRWDTEHQQVTGNLAVGGRIVIDLTTGETTIAATSGPGEIVLGGRRYQCRKYGIRNLASRIANLNIEYAPEGGVVYLGFFRNVVATIEGHIAADDIRDLGASANCRYVAAALHFPDKGDIWETYVWEVATRRRIGVFEDAREIPHTLTWDTAEKHLLVETRKGAYLWNLETDERLLVTDFVNPTYGYYLYGQRQPRSFAGVFWDAGRKQLLAVPLASPNAVVAYDVQTGQEATRYTVPAAPDPVNFITSDDSRLLVTYADQQVILWDRETGTQTPLDFSMSDDPYTLSTTAISTNNRYLAYVYNHQAYIWDLAALAPGAGPAASYQLKPLYDRQVRFVNGDTLNVGYSYPEVRLNVATGQVFESKPLDVEAQTVVNFVPLDGRSGPGYRGRFTPGENCPEQPYYDREARQLYLHNIVNDERRLLVDDLNLIRTMILSPDCRTLYTEVRSVNSDLPYVEIPTGITGWYEARFVRVMLWDVATGSPLFTGTQAQRPGRFSIWWSPDGERILIEDAASMLIDARRQSVVPLRLLDTGMVGFGNRAQVYWDYSRGLVYVSGYSAVIAFDMQTGEERLRFTVAEWEQRGCNFADSRSCDLQVSPEGEWLFVFGRHALGAWNINTLQHAYLPVESLGQEHGGYVSPDGRYLIIARSAIRVWDLWSLPENFADRTPIATFGVRMRQVPPLHFVDNTTIELELPTETGTVTARYDILTGTRLDG